tara:strand:+ start:289 stop:615 length:327 start_codon:yes stop_codon:yes gene_type:complete
MQLTTIEQLKEVKENDLLFLINPFSNGNQQEIKTSAFYVTQVKDRLLAGRSLSSGTEKINHFADMIRDCKYVFTELAEADDKLKEIHAGLHEIEVKKHHNKVSAAHFI